MRRTEGGTSLNRVTVKLLRRGAGPEDGPRANTVGSSLDHLIGTWSDAEADEFDQVLRDFETIDGAGGPSHRCECTGRLNENNYDGQMKDSCPAK